MREAGGVLGDLLALVGGVMTAIYILAGRRIRQRVSLVPYVFIVYTSSSLVLIATSLALGIGFQPSGDLRRELLLFLGLALVSIILGHTLYNWSLKCVKAPVVSTSLLGEPVGATLLAFLFLAEAPRATDLLGASSPSWAST